MRSDYRSSTRRGRSTSAIISQDEGAIALMVAVLIVFLLAFAAVAVDAGAYYAHRRQMQTAADAAALAGVQELPTDPVGAETVAQEYAAANSPEASDSEFTVGSTYVPNDTITVELLDPAMGLFFARAIGRDTAPVDARARAVIGSPTTYGSGVQPIGIMAQGSTDPPYGYENAGEQIEIKPKDGTTGNWGFIDLFGYVDGINDPNSQAKFIEGGGTETPLSIGEEIDPQSGDPQVPNVNALNNYMNATCGPHPLEELVYDAERGVYEPTHLDDGSHCNRLITFPVVVSTVDDPYSWEGQNGASKPLVVVGFINFFIDEDLDKNEKTISATFVQTVPVDVLDPGGYVPWAGVMYWLAE